MQTHETYRPHAWRATPGLIPGLIVIGVGVLFLLDNFHLLYVRDWWQYWPVALIAVGLVKLVDSTFTGGRIVGGVLIGLGGLFLARNFGLLSVALEDFWPLFLIGAGLVMLWHRAWAPWQERGGDSSSHLSSPNALSLYAIFSGGKRRITSQNFEGGQVSAMFGGFEIDLRKASMTGDSAVLDINAMFGGVGLRIPEHWMTVVQVVSIFGGVDDKTVSPDPRTPGVKRLIVKGAVIFGGVDVKN